MIHVVSGKTGFGKSYYMVMKIRDHLAGGGCVATNIALDHTSISKAVGRRLSPNQIIRIDADTDPRCIPSGDLRGHGTRKTWVVLDECLNWFQSQVGGKDSRKVSWSEWLRQSDKLGQQVFFIAQNFERAAKWIRELAAVSIEIFPLRDVRIGMIFPLWLLFPPFKNMFCAKVRDVRSGMINGLSLHRYSPSVYRLYNTSETFGFVGASSAYDSVRLWPRYRNPLRFVVLAFALFLLTSFLAGLAAVFSGVP